MHHFFDAAEPAGEALLLHGIFVFRCDVDGHRKTQESDFRLQMRSTAVRLWKLSAYRYPVNNRHNFNGASRLPRYFQYTWFYACCLQKFLLDVTMAFRYADLGK